MSTVGRSSDTLDVHPHRRLQELPLCRQQPYWRYPCARYLASAGGGAPLVQHGVAARGRGHEDPIAVLDYLLDIVEGGVEPAVWHIVCLADVQDLLDALQHLRMVVLPRVAQL